MNTTEEKQEIQRIAQNAGLPVHDCIVCDTFLDAKNPFTLQREYCVKNCGLKCVKGLDYMKR